MWVRVKWAAAATSAPMLGAAALAATLSGALIGRSGSLRPGPVLALLAVAGVVILLSLEPAVLFVSWLALGPFLQDFGSYEASGHFLGLALYQAPPLVLLLWTLSRRTDRRPLVLDVFPFLFVLYGTVSVLLSTDHSPTAIRLFYVTTVIGVIVYYFLVFGGTKSLTAPRAIRLLLVLSTLEALMSIVDGVTGWNLWHHVYAQGGIRRATATLGTPPSLGSFIGIGAVLGLAVLVWNGPRQLRRLAIANLALGIPGLYFTYTRGPIIGTVVAGTLILASRMRTRLLAFVFVILVSGVLVASWGPITHSRVYHERVAQTHNVDLRAELDRWSLKLWKQRPLLGWGYGSFDRVLRSANFSSGDIQRQELIANTSHNSFLRILVEWGGVGLAIFIVPWLVIVYRALQQARRDPSSRWLLVGATGGLVVYVGAANASDFRVSSFVPAVAWLLLALLRRHEPPRVT
jgi:O-antigen ligase